jgi:hypothetical protein
VSAPLPGLATFAVICASPWPAVLAVVSTAMARGFAAAMVLLGFGANPRGAVGSRPPYGAPAPSSGFAANPPRRRPVP